MFLFIPLIFILSTSVQAKVDCNDIDIFKRHIDLSACDLEERIDQGSNAISNVKITRFRYAVVRNTLNLTRRFKMGVLRFTADYDGARINFKCNTFTANKTSQGIRLQANHCKGKNYCVKPNTKVGIEIKPIIFPDTITTRKWR
ncbi:MAG: hypothetical protein OXB84_04550 [Halobacteriovoraceae bacterium]|nr:hypothetical protein [Halobacteriovoraceae bacterium]